MATDTKAPATRRAPGKKAVAKNTVNGKPSESAKELEAKTMDVLKLFIRTYSSF